MFADLPPFATFVHAGGRDGFESVSLRALDGAGFLLEGGTAAIEGGLPWSVIYRISVDDAWHTTRVMATGVSLWGHHQLIAEVHDGRWWVDGVARPDLDGCVDIDFESSLVTNTLPVHRLDLTSESPTEVPAVFVRAEDLRVERLEQTYVCAERTEAGIAVDYTSSTFGVACRLLLDPSGLVVDYPDLGRRHR